MKKFISLILALALVMTVLTGCGGGNKSTGEKKGDKDTLVIAND